MQAVSYFAGAGVACAVGSILPVCVTSLVSRTFKTWSPEAKALISGAVLFTAIEVGTRCIPTSSPFLKAVSDGAFIANFFAAKTITIRHRESRLDPTLVTSESYKDERKKLDITETACTCLGLLASKSFPSKNLGNTIAAFAGAFCGDLWVQNVAERAKKTE